MNRILIIGATSAIAEACARRWLERAPGARLFLVARSPVPLGAIAGDLRVRGAEVATAALDVDALDRHVAVLDEAWAFLGTVDVALVAHGTLPDQRACEADPVRMLAAFHTNAAATLALLTPLANRFAAQGRGTIAVIGSVAGDRGRQSNYVYGAAKAAVSVFLQGLRNRLQRHGVHVLTIKPGFVDTPMTAAFAKGVLWSQPSTVARAIVRACERRADVVYAPWFWRLIMLVIRLLPERLFKRLSL